jgi:hypothetical protein
MKTKVLPGFEAATGPMGSFVFDGPESALNAGLAYWAFGRLVMGSNEPIPLIVLHGPVGSGKTRFFRQFCVRNPAEFAGVMCSFDGWKVSNGKWLNEMLLWPHRLLLLDLQRSKRKAKKGVEGITEWMELAQMLTASGAIEQKRGKSTIRTVFERKMFFLEIPEGMELDCLSRDIMRRSLVIGFQGDKEGE